MRVWIENSSQHVDKLKGKSLFCKRLSQEFIKLGVEVVDGTQAADISLNVIRIKHHRSKKKLLRIDGVWHDTAKNFRQKNKALSQSIKEADGVVYQSEFARNMADRYLGVAKCPTRVIFNGTDPEIYNIESAKFNKKVFIAFSKWRPHKRLRDIIKSFLLADIKNSQLLIIGNVDNCGIPKHEFDTLIKHKDIEYIGSLPQSKLIPILKGSTASIHLCWFDACPNSVVEAICAGVPVITNNVGGTWEIVAPSGGFVCNVDKPYDLNPVDLYNPPKIDRNLIAQAMIKCAENRPVINNTHVNIKNTAKEYLEFMREIL